MSRGLAYDSQKGRNLAAAITALQSGHCYAQSAKIANVKGAFAGFEKNKESVTAVMRQHSQAAKMIEEKGVPEELFLEAQLAWERVVKAAEETGLRNAQISVLAPTGTISFLMDCDTTGIEPDIALVKYKWLVGGGMIKMVNKTIPEALNRLGYSTEQMKDILAHIEKEETIEGAPHVKETHFSVFDCAFKPTNGDRSIHYLGHLRMMAAVQPFISGAISKTVNLPESATQDDIANVFMQGWKMGLKAIAVYRDGSKRQQAVTTTAKNDDKKEIEQAPQPMKQPDPQPQIASAPDQKIKPTVPTTTVDAKNRRARRRRLPDERRSITHKFKVGSHKGYITVGLYDDGSPGELFVTMAKEGSVISGLIDGFATSISIGLQYGVPLEVLVNKFVHMRFEPSGFTNNPQIRVAKSIIDYIFRWMAIKFLPRESQIAVGVNIDQEEGGQEENELVYEEVGEVVAQQQDQPKLFEPQQEADLLKIRNAHSQTFDNQSDAPICDMCGSIMVRNASCYKCLNCGVSSGCS